jgi:murein DD-endopeptidase MepM/ murein hydrolase activator NlpD
LKTKWYQLIIIIMIIINIDYITALKEYQEKEIKFYNNVVSEFGIIINNLEKEKKFQEEKYNNTIIKIVENIKRNDSFLNVGGYNNDLPYDKKEYYEKMLTGSSDLDTLLLQTENFFQERNEYLSNIPNIWPIKNSSLLRITSPFGVRFNPFTNELTQHNGIDIAGPWKAEIIATADGIVKDHWIYHPEFGRMIVLEHDNDFKTIYAHLAKSYVHEGYKVKKGDVIGLMGNSGTATGAHLHYEVRVNSKALDPINFLRIKKE